MGLSFEQPLESIESIVKATLIILNAIRSTGKLIKFYSAGSVNAGNTNSLPADENTIFNPCDYGIAKRLHIGWLNLLDLHTNNMHALEYYLIMNHRSDQNGLLLKSLKLF